MCISKKTWNVRRNTTDSDCSETNLDLYLHTCNKGLWVERFMTNINDFNFPIRNVKFLSVNMILLHLYMVCLYPTWSAIYYLRSKLLNRGYNKHAINHSFKHCIVYIMNKLIYYRISVSKVIANMHQSQRVSLMELDTRCYPFLIISLVPLLFSVEWPYIYI